MNRYLNESSKIKIINNLLVIVIALFGLSQKRFDLSEMSLFQKMVTEVVAPMQQSIATSKKSFDLFIDEYFKIVNTNKENIFLKTKIIQLEEDLFRLEEIRTENNRLRQMLSFSEELAQKKIMAQVVGWDSANQFKVLRINQGQRNGISTMDPVITSKGLVGYVYRVGYNYSDVLTILDPNNRVDVIVERTRTHGIVEGVYNFSCQLKYINKNEPIEIGDRVVTAGVGGIYPKGIKVGVISGIEQEGARMMLGVDVSPSVDFHQLEEVIVLVQDKKEDIELEKN